MTLPSTPLPYSVIGGFLGAGKTTLVNHWLRHAAGQRLAVLVNDFGALNLDAHLIASTAADTIALTNGCVCCQIGDDLSRALIGVLERAADFDAVVVEASGVSDPARIAQLGRADPGLRPDGVVVVVDAGQALAQAADPRLADTLERQVRAADLIVVNHCDDAADLPALRAWVGAVAGATPSIETTRAQVPLALLSGHAMPRAAAVDDHRHHRHHADHGQLFETWSCRPARQFDLDALHAWLRDPPAGVLRLKGVLRTGTRGWSELQFAGRRGSVRAADAPDDGTAVVAIGLNGTLPRRALAQVFGD